MKWKQLQYVIRSEYGQDGVYFVNDRERRQVLKAPESPYAELFLTFLAKSFGLNTPTFRAIRPDSSEYTSMIEALKPHIEESNASLRAAQEQEYKKSDSERNLELIEKRTLDLESLPTFFLMEDLGGRSLRDVTQQDLEDWYGEDEVLNLIGQKFFTDLGKLLVFDILIRNVDRFIFWKLPGIGEIESALGNLGNFFIRDETKELTVIDSLSDRNVEVADYANAVKEVLAKTLNALPDNLVDRGQETLELTGYEVKDNARTLMLQGIREGVNHLQILNKGKTLEQIKHESMQQLSESEEKKIDALFQFIKRIGEQITTFAIVSPIVLHFGFGSVVPILPQQTLTSIPSLASSIVQSKLALLWLKEQAGQLEAQRNYSFVY